MSFKTITGILQLDFQINRILTYGEEACNEAEVLEASKEITDLGNWFDTWYQLGEKAEGEKRNLHAAYYYRLAEFFLKDSDPFKTKSYQLSIKNFHHIIDRDSGVETFYVPYESTELKVHKYKATNEKAEIVVFGGYDSFIEEFYLAIKEICDYGYTVYVFEGPGQGQTLKNGLSFEPHWEKPLSAILDYFNLSDIIVIGISWGGYLALRAAAFEKRVKKVIAYDVLYDGFDCMTNPFPPLAKGLIRALFFLRLKGVINSLMEKFMTKKLLINWAISHGQYITGTDTPYDFYRHLMKHTLKGIEEKIDCDVLLLAGEKDHYIPRSHFEILKSKLSSARSLEARMFTADEGGEQHCQIGNHRIAVEYIMKWLGAF